MPNYNASELFNQERNAISSLRAEQRIAKSLIRFIEHSGKTIENGVMIGFPISRQDVADYTGTNMCTASRILSEWEKRGWIVSGREKIILKDIQAIIRLAENDFP